MNLNKLRLNSKIFLLTFQNGYPSRRRSLVDDARFESIVVKQTKQTVLEEAREKANGKWNQKFSDFFRIVLSIRHVIRILLTFFFFNFIFFMVGVLLILWLVGLLL